MKKLEQLLQNKSVFGQIMRISFVGISIDYLILFLAFIFVVSFWEIFDNFESPFFQVLFGSDIEDSGFFSDLFFLSILAPLFETILFHVPFISILRKFKLPNYFVLTLTTVAFSSLHVGNGLIALIFTLPSSFLIAYTYLYYIKESFSKAVFGAMAVHSLINTGIVLLIHSLKLLL
jgi:membrane protease YdiL (CAAX protease family)